MTKPYEGTTVSVGKTQGEIDDMLAGHGIVDVRWTTTTTLKMVEFHHRVKGEKTGRSPEYGTCPEHGIKHRIQHNLYAIRAILGVRIVVAWTIDEREQRRLMRLLYWMLKSKFEIVESGLAVFEEEFMPHLTIDRGRRVYDRFKIGLDEAIAAGEDLSAGIGNSGLLAIGSGS